MRAKLVRPLDWLVVPDHAGNLGLAPIIEESAPDLLRIPWGRKIHDMTTGARPDAAYAIRGATMGGKDRADQVIPISNYHSSDPDDL